VAAGILLTSCVYFNTFYNAETSFKKAMKIIEESPILEEDDLPSQAKKLLGEAIENSKIVLMEYPDSKYVDDAVFIIGKASFLRDETAIAEKNFRNLLRDFPQSEFYTQSRIWLAYTHFRMGMADSAEVQLLSLQSEKLSDKENLYLLYNALAEIALEKADYQMVYTHYEAAAENAPSQSKKTATFGKLVKIAETTQDKEKASSYLVSLGEVAPDKIRIDAKMQWIIYQRELGNYEDIIEEIETMLGLSEFAQEYMQLELELGKVYKDRGELALAKEIFTQMGENYSKKNETAEAYYHLGFLALMEDFNLDLAKEYFEKSKSEKSQSRYGKESRELLNKISRFENLVTLYKDAQKEYNQNYEEGDVKNSINNPLLELNNIYNTQKKITTSIIRSINQDGFFFSETINQINNYQNLNKISKELTKDDVDNIENQNLIRNISIVLQEMKELIKLLDPSLKLAGFIINNVHTEKNIKSLKSFGNSKIDNFFIQSRELLNSIDEINSTLKIINNNLQGLTIHPSGPIGWAREELFNSIGNVNLVNSIDQINGLKDYINSQVQLVSSISDDLIKLGESVIKLVDLTPQIYSEIKKLKIFQKIKASKQLATTAKELSKLPIKIKELGENSTQLLNSVDNIIKLIDNNNLVNINPDLISNSNALDNDEKVSGFSKEKQDSLILLTLDRITVGLDSTLFFKEKLLKIISTENNIVENNNRNDRDNPPEFRGQEMDDRYAEFRDRMNPGFSQNFPDAEMPSPNQPAGSSTITADSLLFVIGEMLLYDFNRLELSLEKFKSLAAEYPQSKFAPQALYVLSHYEPGKPWREQLFRDYPNSPFSTISGDSLHADSTLTLVNARDNAWKAAETSYEKSYTEFLRLSEENEDTLSAYITGFISDYYLHDIEKTVTQYQAFVDSFPGHFYTTEAQHRLDEIKLNIEEIKAVSLQGLEYQAAIVFFQEFHDYDSVKVLLNNISNGENSRFKDAANHLKSVLRDYLELEEEIVKQTAVSEADTSQVEMMIPTPEVQDQILDSLYYRMAELYSHQLDFLDSAIYYHKIVIEEYKDSKFRPQSYFQLTNLNPEGNWEDQMKEAYPDTSFVPDSTVYPEVYLAEVFLDDFISTQEENIKKCEDYLALFPQPADTIEMAQDSFFNSADSLISQVDSLYLPMDSLALRVDSLNFQSDTLTIPPDSLTLPAESDTLNNGKEEIPAVKEELTP